MSRVLPPIPYVPCTHGKLRLYTHWRLSVLKNLKLPMEFTTYFRFGRTADFCFLLYLFWFPLIPKKKKKTNCNSVFVGVSNYRTPYSMLLIINTFNEFLKVIRGAEKLLVLSRDEYSCSRKIYLINGKELILTSVFILCQRWNIYLEQAY